MGNSASQGRTGASRSRAGSLGWEGGGGGGGLLGFEGGGRAGSLGSLGFAPLVRSPRGHVSDESRRRRGRDADIPLNHVAATPRVPRG